MNNKKQTRILETVEDRFLKELDVVQLLQKLRDSYDLLSKMQKKNQRSFLQYNRRRVICHGSSSKSNSSSDVSSSDEERDKGMNYNDQLKVAIIRGMHIEHTKKRSMIDKVRQKDSKKIWNKLSEAIS